MIKLRKLRLSLMISLFALIYFKGMDCTGSADINSRSGGFSFPILKNEDIKAKRSPIQQMGRLVNPQVPKNKGWLKAKGRAVDDEEGKKSEESENKDKKSEESENKDKKSEESENNDKKSEETENKDKKSEESEAPKKESGNVKHVTSFTFTDDKDEGYDKVLEEAKEEMAEQREKENKIVSAEKGPDGLDLLGLSEKPFRSGYSKLYEMHANDVPLVDPILYLKELKSEFAKKNLEEMERYKKRKKLMAIMEGQGTLDKQNVLH